MMNQPSKAATMSKAAIKRPIVLRSRSAIMSKSQYNISLTLAGNAHSGKRLHRSPFSYRKEASRMAVKVK